MWQDFVKFMVEGGWVMWPILGVGAIAIAIALERAIYLYVLNHKDSRKLVSVTLELVAEGKVKEAIHQIERKKTPLRRLVHVALTRYQEGLSIDEIRKGVEEAAIKQVPRLSSRLNLLSLLANVATLLGLLGTIFGLQDAFHSLRLAEGAAKAQALALGISTAMNTTAFGLVVAIPCMIAYTQLINRQSKLTDDLDEATLMVLNTLEGFRK